MSIYSSNVLLVVFVILMPLIRSIQNCLINSTSVGCLTCNNQTSQSLAFNTSQFKYTCIQVLNCSSVALNKCTSCTPPFTLDSLTSTCLLAPGCIDVFNATCLECQAGWVNLGGNCFLRNIRFCLQYGISGGLFRCKRCLFVEMNAGMNCTILPNVCAEFDYQIMRCGRCNAGMAMHSDGRSCYQPIPNCETPSPSTPTTCLQCSENYISNPTTSSCMLGQQQGVRSQLLSYTYLEQKSQYTYLCLNNRAVFNTTTFACSNIANNHCAVTNASGCQICIPGYFFKVGAGGAGTCLECSVFFSSCALCVSQSVCFKCLRGYFLLKVPSGPDVCMACSSYGCVECSLDFDPNAKVKCLTCPANRTLSSGSCISCQNPMSSYSIVNQSCLPCNSKVPNCISCNFAYSTGIGVLQPQCLQCSFSYYFNPANLNSTISCQPILNSTVVTFSTAYQIIRKIASGSQLVFYPDGSGLVSACGVTDGFVCICQDVGLTSLCNRVSHLPDISQIVFRSTDLIAKYPDILRMAAELPNFNLMTQLPVVSYLEMSLYQFWSLLSAFTFTILRNQENGITNFSPIISRIFQHSRAMINVFSDQKITILRGNGFYFKFIPAGLVSGGIGDDNYISTNVFDSQYVIIYAHFPRLAKTANGAVTGTTYILTNSILTSLKVTIRKTREGAVGTKFIGKTDTLTLNSNITLRNGFLDVQSFPKSTIAQPQGISIYGVASESLNDLYAAQRIQNIFYSQSWIYVLFFVAMYLLFIPLCAIVDCCEAGGSMRKRVQSEEEHNDSNKEDPEETILKINYRNFFPMYNVGNTPRPGRLAKLCLYIVNLQHIITFLTVIYVNLPGAIPVAAIALVIPAYLCTVAMGYICGALFRLLPGHAKLAINVFSLGYWVLWIFVMRLINQKPSSQYRLYILVFSILSFFLDLLIDALETLLVYFSIKQGQKQISLFKCLAKWLSLRGFYQFDELAKKLQENVQ